MAFTTINKSTDNFNTKLYTGNGSTNHAITGIGFAPDLVWQKRRDALNGHVWFDNVRGATKIIQSDASSAEITSTSGNDTISLDSDGFTVGVPAQTGGINPNGASCVAWNWLANGAGSSNTDGSITSTVSANTTAGFSIVSYTGTGANATVGHGLNAVPKMIIVKRRDANDSWWTFNSNLGSNDAYLALQSTAASSTAGGNTLWNSTAPTSSVFSVGTNSGVNGSSSTYVAYCFAEKTGYSKIGSYTGTASTNGPMIFTGFKPAFFLFKRTDAVKDWHIIDNKRDIDNPTQTILYPNANFAEGTPTAVDFVSNGIKIRNGGSFVNEVNGTYIYMAIGQSLVGSNDVPCTAR